MTAYLEAIAALLAVALVLTTRSRLLATRKARAAVERSERYRQAFVDLLRGDFTDLDDMLLRLLRCARDTLAVERVSLWLFDEERSSIRRRALVVRDEQRPEGPAQLSSASHPHYFAAVTQAFVIAAEDAVNDARTAEFRDAYLLPLGIGAMLDVPLRRFGAHIGLMCIEHLGGPRAWTLEDQGFASAVASQITYAFEHAAHRQAREELVARTLHDSDTDLPNGVMLRDRIEAALAAGQGCALVLANLPRMRLVLASRGRNFADALARAMAERWRTMSGHGRMLARTSRDEFALFLPGETQAQAATGWALRLCASLDEPLLLEGERFRVEVAVGVASCDPDEIIGADDLIAEASSAMRSAAVGSVSVFDPEMRQRAHRRLQIEQSLRQAIDQQAFETWLQPVIDLVSCRVVEIEALLRWRDPVHGIVPPAAFLTEAIESGLIVPIGRQAMAGTIRMYAQARRSLNRVDWKLALNLAAPELMAEDLEPFLLNCLDEHAVPVECVVVEVTETALVKDLDRAQRTLEHLRAAGACICLDDFGTGFSSLTWLKRFPITQIKIESSFVRGIGYDPRDEAIVQSVVDLAAKLGQEIVAEGVENLEQLRRLRSLGVRQVQGFLFSEPFPASELSDERLLHCLQPLATL
ncbi:MAG: sensor domain-containing phosphodiesterase [Rhodanobacteraceae bacterium]|nr:sensor domain-containing phosphodiesterase [Rhodanobacteraceae bacterium]